MERASAARSSRPAPRRRPSGPGRALWALLAPILAVFLALPACGEGTSGAVGSNPITGELIVTTSTSGSNLDPDGYSATLEPGAEDEESAEIGLNGSHTFTSVEPGFRIVELGGVAENCSVSGDNPREVSIVVGVTARTAFEVTCG